MIYHKCRWTKWLQEHFFLFALFTFSRARTNSRSDFKQEWKHENDQFALAHCMGIPICCCFPGPWLLTIWQGCQPISLTPWLHWRVCKKNYCLHKAIPLLLSLGLAGITSFSCDVHRSLTFQHTGWKLFRNIARLHLNCVCCWDKNSKCAKTGPSDSKHMFTTGISISFSLLLLVGNNIRTTISPNFDANKCKVLRKCITGVGEWSGCQGRLFLFRNLRYQGLEPTFGSDLEQWWDRYTTRWVETH